MRADPRNEPGWPSAFALIGLSVIPVIGGALRLLGIAPGTPVTPANARFVEAPVPIVLHVAGASLFCVFGALQFVASFRRRAPRWHRVAGRVWTVRCSPRAVDTGGLMKRSPGTSGRTVLGA